MTGSTPTNNINTNKSKITGESYKIKLAQQMNEAQERIDKIQSNKHTEIIRNKKKLEKKFIKSLNELQYQKKLDINIQKQIFNKLIKKNQSAFQVNTIFHSIFNKIFCITYFFS